MKLIYRFGGEAVTSANILNNDMVHILGNKGLALIHMSNMGLNVPPGFVISTELCKYFLQHQNIPDNVIKIIKNATDELLGLHVSIKNANERHSNNSSNIRAMNKTSKQYISNRDSMLIQNQKNEIQLPVALISVRSGAAVSMPGMMDTILNVGLNDDVVERLSHESGNRRFAYDSYRRLIQMYANAVNNITNDIFDNELQKELMTSVNHELSEEATIRLTSTYKKIFHEITGNDFPQDPHDQMMNAIIAVLSSWNCDRAKKYREIHKIPNDIGTAVVIQKMVFGNMGNDCATGVVFTRSPINGQKQLFGEFLINAQGEDIVSGCKNANPITNANVDLSSKSQCDPSISQEYSNQPPLTLDRYMPDVFRELQIVCDALEDKYHNMQDIEFTIERGKLWILQARTGKRTAEAAFKISVDLVNEGKSSIFNALRSLEPSMIDKLLHPSALDDNNKNDVIAKGLAASPGIACGVVALSARSAENMSKDGLNVILVRQETSPEDIGGMYISDGILTCRGGITSHAAVVARGMGKPCVCGATDIFIDYNSKLFVVNGYSVKEGDIISINGGNGDVLLGEVATKEVELGEIFDKVMLWASECKKIDVRANAETSLDVKAAFKYDADGIGLCRTEHMFFAPDRLLQFRKMILLDKDSTDRSLAITSLLKHQRDDFVEIFFAMRGLPVTIRLLDPPLHEFLPHDDVDIAMFCEQSGISYDVAKRKIQKMQEVNPMLGHRGCRLGITNPEIYEMQITAIFEAILELQKNNAISVNKIFPEIMVPFIIDVKEVLYIKELVFGVLERMKMRHSMAEYINYKFGVMIEVARAALRIDDIAPHIDFFSFGTNDLTQTTLGLSRDDCGAFISKYVESDILQYNPFEVIDVDGVGELMKIAIDRAKAANGQIRISVCGEHGGNPQSIEFFCKIGVHSVSCSPYRIPAAKLAAARAAL